MKRKEYKVILWDFQLERKWNGYYIPHYLNKIQEFKIRLTEEEFESGTLTVEHIIRTFHRNTGYKLAQFLYDLEESA